MRSIRRLRIRIHQLLRVALRAPLVAPRGSTVLGDSIGVPITTPCGAADLNGSRPNGSLRMTTVPHRSLASRNANGLVRVDGVLARRRRRRMQRAPTRHAASSVSASIDTINCQPRPDEDERDTPRDPPPPWREPPPPRGGPSAIREGMPSLILKAPNCG